MNNSQIREDFFHFELNYLNSNLSENNFYQLLDDKNVNNFIIDCVEKKFYKNITLDKTFNKNLNELSIYLKNENLDFKNFKFFKSETDLLTAYLFLFLIKTFSLKTKHLKHGLVEFESFLIKDFFLDRNDFVNIFLDYLHKFFIYNEIIHKKIFFSNKNFLRIFSFRFVEFCVANNLIILKDVKTSNRRYKVLIFELFTVPFIPEITFFTLKFNVYVRLNNEPYIYNTHFFSVILVTKQATYSNAMFKINLNQIDSLTQRSFFIYKNLLYKNYKFLLEDSFLSEDDDLQKIFNDVSLKVMTFINEKDIESLKIYHSKLSEILTLIRIKTILDMDFNEKEIFLPFMFCFRGRIYDLGNLSFTFYKEFRFCSYSGIYENEDEKFHPINNQIFSTLDDHFYLFKNFNWFNNLSLIRKRTCLWLFISMGVLEKEKLGKKVHISTFLLKGIELWESKKEKKVFSDVYEKIEYNYILFLIDELINSIKLKKWIYWKDATASCFQHLLLILGERDENSYAICNLNSIDYWYDPYAYLISDFFEKKKESKLDNCNYYDDTRFMSIFSRKRLKRVIMTESYGAGFKKLTSYFFLNLNLNEFSMSEKEKISQIWEEFFEYLSNENVLFAQSSKAIISLFENNNLKVIRNPDDTEVDYSCFVIQITQNEFYFNKKRHTYRTRSMTTDFDTNQFNTSLRANFVQTRDALLARKYILYTKMWTVHDCFSIDFLNITYMVSVVNELMNGEFFDLKINLKEKRPIYSIFVIL